MGLTVIQWALTSIGWTAAGMVRKRVTTRLLTADPHNQVNQKVLGDAIGVSNYSAQALPDICDLVKYRGTQCELTSDGTALII
jgi:hypothetical protein